MDNDRIYQLFHELANLPADQQAARLVDLRQSDPSLADELASLLNAHRSATHFLEEPLQIEFVDAGENLYVGRLLGAYRIERLIARGGMGMVFLARRDDGAYDRRVAIKLVDAAVADTEAVAQFHRERGILAALEHPNIAGVIDGGITPDGQPYLAMPFVDGEPINRHVEQAQYDQRRKIELFLTVCRAVSHAHSNLVVHRDLKPGNILVDADGHVTLLDFGIAKVLAEDAAELTRTSTRKYTPLYAAPEQLSGGKITTATDIYSLGVILQELLTGVPPVFSSAGPHSTPASAALDPDLRTIVETCKEESPQRRYATVDALASDLQRYLDNRPIEARPASWAYRTGKFLRRNRGAAVSVGALALLLISYAATVAYQNRVISAERDRAVLEQRKSAQIADFLQSILWAADPAESGRDVTVREVLAHAMGRIEGGLDGQTDLQASLAMIVASTYSNLGELDSAMAAIEHTIGLLERQGKANHADMAQALRMAGRITEEYGLYDRALGYHRRAVDWYRAQPGPDSLEYAKALYFHASTLLELNNWSEAERDNRHAVAIYEKAHKPDTVQWASALNNLAQVLGMLERFDEAVPAHERALQLMVEYYGKDHVDVASTLYNLGGVLEAQGKHQEAVPYYEQALAMRRPLLGDDHPLLIINLSTVASAHLALDTPSQGLPYVEEALGIARRTLPSPHPLTAYALNVYGSLLSEIPQRRSECEPMLREAYQTRQAVLPEGHWTIASTQGILGSCLLRLGKSAEAEPLLRASLTTMTSIFGPDHSRTRQAAERVAEFERSAAAR